MTTTQDPNRPCDSCGRAAFMTTARGIRYHTMIPMEQADDQCTRPVKTEPGDGQGPCPGCGEMVPVTWHRAGDRYFHATGPDDREYCPGKPSEKTTEIMEHLHTVPTEEFVECNTCHEKPGSPELCFGCLSNRAIIRVLQAEVELKEKQRRHWEDSAEFHIANWQREEKRAEAAEANFDTEHKALQEAEAQLAEVVGALVYTNPAGFRSCYICKSGAVFAPGEIRISHYDWCPITSFPLAADKVLVDEEQTKEEVEDDLTTLNSQYDSLNLEKIRLKAENERLQDALEFYANGEPVCPAAFDEGPCGAERCEYPECSRPQFPVWDKGAKAQAALAPAREGK